MSHEVFNQDDVTGFQLLAVENLETACVLAHGWRFRGMVESSPSQEIGEPEIELANLFSAPSGFFQTSEINNTHFKGD